MDGSATNGERRDAAAAAGETAEGPVAVSQQLLDATRLDEAVDPHLSWLASADDAELAPLRADHETALAFWLNLYNAGTQLLLDRRPELYDSLLRMLRFFGTTAITVGGTDLSLDDIEQGILRGSRSKYGLGYLPRLRPGEFERRYRIDLDPRIHFALNCGAASCPAIRYYEPDRADDQLDAATRSYLDGTVEYDPDAGVVRVPRVFLWYRGDFGGGSGIRDLLREYDAIPEDASQRISYQSWDWSRAAKKFE